MSDAPRLSKYYGSCSDDDLIAAYRGGPGSYNPEAWQIIAAEMAQRRLGVPSEVTSHSAAETTESRPTTETALELLTRGIPATEVARRLEQQGIAPAHASQIASSADAALKAEVVAGSAQVTGGAVVLGVGVAVTALTFMFAVNGGMYVIAWGAMAAGIVNIVRGNLRRDRARGYDPTTGRPRVADGQRIAP